jgi:hypothetical protein
MPTIEESGITQHLLIPHEMGRVLSNVTGETKQYGAACDPSKHGLPFRANTAPSHSFTDDARAVTCALCKKTKEFADDYLRHTGTPYEDKSNGN